MLVAVGLVALVGAGGLGGCAAQDPGAEVAEPTRIEALAAEAESEPIGVLQQTGLEAHYWLADDTDDAFARAFGGSRLARLGGDGAEGGSGSGSEEFDGESLERWRASGLRVYSLPPGSFAPLQGALPPRQAWERLWLGQPVAWRELVAGRSLSSSELVRIEDQTIPVPAGRLRLLVRSWLTPDADRPAIHLELVPQIAQRNPALTVDPNNPVTRINELEAGRVFADLRLRARLVPGRVYVIVPAAPEEDWDAIAAVAARREQERRRDEGSERPDVESEVGGGSAPAVAEGAEPGVSTPYEVPQGPIGPVPGSLSSAYGPGDAGPLTLGQAAFQTDPVAPDSARQAGGIAIAPPVRRMVIVLIPRAGEDFRLIP
ncbi:MAG: hypothetical protein ACTS3F_02890 [Phycisphaerales bacterium]